MNPAQFEQLPQFIKKEMESISAKIRPIMKKVSTYYIVGFPLMLIGIFNIIIYLFNTDFNTDSYIVPIVYAFIAALGLALFRESRQLKKDIHEVGKDHIIERINKSRIMGEEEKGQYIVRIKQHGKMNLQPFFKFLAEENRRNKDIF